MHRRVKPNVIVVIVIVADRRSQTSTGEAMNFPQRKSITVPEIALIAVTRGAIGFGAGLLLAGKLRRERRRVLGWTLFLSGLASTIPIALHLFRKSDAISEY